MEFNVESMTNMLKCQLLPNGIRDTALLSSIAETPREPFVAGHLRGVAYLDDDLEIISGRYLAEPVSLARLLQIAEIKKTDKVLDVGCASGYSSAVLAKLASKVFAIESNGKLAQSASKNLALLGLDNASVISTDLAEGFPEKAPYDVIFIGGAISVRPDKLLLQLASGGKLITVMDVEGVRRACIFWHSANGISMRTDFEAQIASIPGFEKEIKFEF